MNTQSMWPESNNGGGFLTSFAFDTNNTQGIGWMNNSYVQQTGIQQQQHPHQSIGQNIQVQQNVQMHNQSQHFQPFANQMNQQGYLGHNYYQQPNFQTTQMHMQHQMQYYPQQSHGHGHLPQDYTNQQPQPQPQQRSQQQGNFGGFSGNGIPLGVTPQQQQQQDNISGLNLDFVNVSSSRF